MWKYKSRYFQLTLTAHFSTGAIGFIFGAADSFDAVSSPGDLAISSTVQ